MQGGVFPVGGSSRSWKMKPEEEMEQQLPPGISESGSGGYGRL